jgi:hypothetical protein
MRSSRAKPAYDTLPAVRTERDSGCPEDEVLLRVLYPGEEGTVLPTVIGHLDGCRRCRVVVADLLQSSRVAAPEPEPGSSGARAFAEGDLVAGRYLILGLVGRGGMGEVYQARDDVLKEVVALKTLAPQIAANPEATDRIKAEVQLARRVSHPNVCRIFDIGLHTSGPAPVFFLTMEMLRGETLRERLATQPFRPNELASVILQMARALAAVHEGGVVHRDFKPENVMLVASADGGPARVVVMDFGLARPTAALPAPPRDDDHRSWTMSGTPAYMAPELRGGATAGPLSDVYAFGMVLLEMLCGPAPKVSNSSAAQTGQRIRSMKRSPLPFPFARSPSNIGGWLSLANRCLVPNPIQRIDGFAPVIREIERKSARASGRGFHRPAVAAGLAVVMAATILAISLAVSSTRKPEGAGAASARGPIAKVSGQRMGTVVLSPLFAAASKTAAAAPGAPSTNEVERRAPERVRLFAPAAKARLPQRKARPETAPEVPERTPDSPPQDSPPARSPSFDDRLRDAELLLVDGDVAAACAIGEQLRTTANDRAAVFRFLGKCYMRAGRAADARASYRRYLQLAPDATDAPFVKGIVGRNP